MSSHQLTDRVHVVVGHPKPGSRTHGIAHLLATALDRTSPRGLEIDSTDLSALAGRLHDPEDPAVVATRRAVTAERLLVVATPSYKGSLTGLLKSFLDLVPPAGLRDTVVVPLVTAGSAVHAAQTDRHLRDVLAAVDAVLPVRSLVLQEPELEHAEAEVSTWAHRWSGVVSATVAAVSDAGRPLAGAAR